MSNIETINRQDLTEIFKALSNPHRLAIFMRLKSCIAPMDEPGNNDCICECVGSLGKDLDIAPSTVSHHLKELNRAGLIKMVRNGKRTECQVDEQVLKTLTEFFGLSCCG